MGTGAGPGRRAILRWAWRLFRREWRQQLLVLSLVTIAVAAAVAGSSMAVNGASRSRGRFGDAGALAQIDGSHPDAARRGVAAARRLYGTIEVIGHTSVAVPGSPRPLDVRSQDPKGIYGHPMLALRSGRYPQSANEIALTKGAADALSTRVGARVALGGVERTVVGRVENPADLNDDFALVRYDANAPAQTFTVLLPSDRRGSDGAVAQRDVPGEARLMLEGAPTDKQAVAAVVLVATTLAMALVCLIAAAGFVVVAQRRQRQLGLLAAIGATERHLRLVMLANGAFVGVMAAVVGGVLGVVGWIAAAPAIEAAAAHRIDRLDLPWGLITECLLLAVGASIAAAWWPARTMARMPVMAALSRRPARPRSIHRSLALALVLIVVGVGAVVEAHPTGDHVRPLVLIAGLLAFVAGLTIAAPAAIRVLGVPAGRLPFAPRLALRDLVRYQARAAAALAAITLSLGISVSIIVVAQASEHRGNEGNLSNRQLFVRVSGDPRTGPDPNLSATTRARLDAAAAQIGSAVGDSSPVALDVALNPASAADATIREPISVGTPISHGFRGFGYPYIATPQVLHRLGVPAATIAGSTELLTSLPGNVILFDSTVRPDFKNRDAGEDQSDGHVQHIALPSYDSAPNSLVTERAVAQHGWIAARAGWFVESTDSLTTQQIAAARQAAASAGLTVESRSAQDGLSTLRTVVTIVGGLLALAIVAMTIGLIRSEAVRDVRTLTATGASGRTRRALTASTAGAIALLGVILSTAGAYAVLIAAYHADLGRLAPAPVAYLVLLAVGVPVVATAGGWLLAGREPRMFARPALD